MAKFAQIPVLQDGRVKSLESFARAELRIFSGRDRLDNMSATDWLAEMLFDPIAASGRPVFRLSNPNVVAQLGLNPGQGDLFSLRDLAPGLAKTEGLIPKLMQPSATALTSDQKDFLSIHDRAYAFSAITGAMAMVLPLGKMDGVEGRTYLELKKDQRNIKTRITALLRKKGDDITAYTEDESALALIGMQMDALEQEGARGQSFKIIPPQWSGQDDWQTAWQSLDSGYGSPWAATYLADWQDMAAAFRAKDKAQWDAATTSALAHMHQVKAGITWPKLKLEMLYNALKPLTGAQFLYAFALMVLMVAQKMSNQAIYRAGIVAGIGAVLLHIIAIAMRVYILSRPPVGTLFESILFVSLIVFLCGMMMERARRDGLSMMGGAVVTLAMLLIAPVFAPNGDSLEMLVAVLNTNFWLATHVIFITTGYGACVFTALVAHWALFCAATGREIGKLQGDVHKGLIAGLFLTAVGTVLGGIWADQSWGRFWGWDPKENGALLIVLWSAWVLHGRYGGFFKRPVFLAAVSFMSVIVALSWFGVNLLGIGLHSYGFTTGMAAGLIAFCVGEAAIIAVMLFMARRNHAD